MVAVRKFPASSRSTQARCSPQALAAQRQSAHALRDLIIFKSDNLKISSAITQLKCQRTLPPSCPPSREQHAAIPIPATRALAGSTFYLSLLSMRKPSHKSASLGYVTLHGLHDLKGSVSESERKFPRCTPSWVGRSSRVRDRRAFFTEQTKATKSTAPPGAPAPFVSSITFCSRFLPSAHEPKTDW
jgi:hypothetical protein